MEIRKREAKVFLISKQIEENEETLDGVGKENNGAVNIPQIKSELL